MRESLTRVPFLVHYPKRVAAATVTEGSEGIDLIPTLLDVVGAPPLDQAQGESLRARASGLGRGWASPAIASMYEYAFAMNLGGWKARVGRTGVPLLFDMVADPLERKDLARTRPIERRYLTDHLGMYLQHRTLWKKARWGTVSNMTEDAITDLGGASP
jgi:choline-sulfatase